MNKPTFANWVEEWLTVQAPHWAPNTMAADAPRIRRIAAYVGYRDVTPQLVYDVVQWVTDMNKSPSTTLHYLTLFRAVLSWLAKMGYAKHMADLVIVPTVPLVEPLRFTPSQYEKLKEVTKGTFWHYGSIVAYRTGMRYGDVCHLRWDSVNMDELYIRYVAQKTRKRNLIATCPFQAGGDLHQILLEQKKTPHPNPTWAPFVCPEMAMTYPFSGPYIDNHEHERFKKYCVKIGAPKLTFHKLRNSFFSRLLNAGTPWPVASQITGIRSYQTFLRYAKPELGVLRKTMDKVDEIDADQETDAPEQLPLFTIKQLKEAFPNG